MKYMQGIQTVGEDFNARMPEMHAAQGRFQTEEKNLIKRYETSLEAAFAPGYARFNALKTKLGVPLDYPTVKGGEGGAPDWAVAEQDAIMRQLDQVYATHCPQWWGATAQIQAWLKTYRTWLTNEWIPFHDRLSSQNAQTYAIMGTPSASWRAVSAQDAVIMYLQSVQRVYGVRREKPRCTAAECGDFL
jgi:hypothetical protein